VHQVIGSKVAKMVFIFGIGSEF